MKEYLLSQEKKNLKLAEIEATAKNFSLQEWLEKLSDEELFNFNPDNDIRPNGMPEKLYQLSKRKKALELAKEYFNIVLWPKKRNQILSENKLIDKVID
jgi:tRNA G10  N-methylase Trm11